MADKQSTKELEDILKTLYRKAGMTEVHNNFKEFKFNGVDEAREAIQRLIEQETIKLSSHLAYMAGEFEGYHGHKNGYLLKNWDGYATLNTKQEGAE